ncbi:MAG: hypothetical protein ABI892_13310 [Flavobacterium sp.]
MKTRLYIAAWVFLSFSFFSCSTDDSGDQVETTNDLKKGDQDYLNKNIYNKVKDSTNVNTNLDINSTTEGDPIIIKPPRKD